MYNNSTNTYILCNKKGYVNHYFPNNCLIFEISTKFYTIHIQNQKANPNNNLQSSIPMPVCIHAFFILD